MSSTIPSLSLINIYLELTKQHGGQELIKTLSYLTSKKDRMSVFNIVQGDKCSFASTTPQPPSYVNRAEVEAKRPAP